MKNIDEFKRQYMNQNQSISNLLSEGNTVHSNNDKIQQPKLFDFVSLLKSSNPSSKNIQIENHFQNQQQSKLFVNKSSQNLFQDVNNIKQLQEYEQIADKKNQKILEENQKKNGENSSLSAIDRFKAIEQFKKMMDIKLNNDKKKMNESDSQKIQIKDILDLNLQQQNQQNCKQSYSAFMHQPIFDSNLYQGYNQKQVENGIKQEINVRSSDELKADDYIQEPLADQCINLSEINGQAVQNQIFQTIMNQQTRESLNNDAQTAQENELKNQNIQISNVMQQICINEDQSVLNNDFNKNENQNKNFINDQLYNLLNQFQKNQAKNEDFQQDKLLEENCHIFQNMQSNPENLNTLEIMKADQVQSNLQDLEILKLIQNLQPLQDQNPLNINEFENNVKPPRNECPTQNQQLMIDEMIELIQLNINQEQQKQICQKIAAVDKINNEQCFSILQQNLGSLNGKESFLLQALQRDNSPEDIIQFNQNNQLFKNKAQSSEQIDLNNIVQQLNIEDIVQLIQLKENTLTEIKELLQIKNYLVSQISEITQNQTLKLYNSDNFSNPQKENQLLETLKKQLSQQQSRGSDQKQSQEIFEDDTVGCFQMQTLYQQYGTIGLSKSEISAQRKKEMFLCHHLEKKHYAKNMCHNCYHRKGKSKMASACIHKNKPHYSNGLCQNCYLAQYYLKRKKKNENKTKENDSKDKKIETEKSSETHQKSYPQSNFQKSQELFDRNSKKCQSQNEGQKASQEDYIQVGSKRRTSHKDQDSNGKLYFMDQQSKEDN